MSLTPEQVATIKATVPVVQEHGNTITTAFYHNMLDENPELKNTFNLTNQFNGHQQKALATALYAYAANIDNLGVLSKAVERITQKHASLFIKPEQYDIVGKYLLAAMGQVLGDALTPAILDAWTAAYGQLATIMINAEEELYADDKKWREWRDFRIASKVKESSIITSFYLEPVEGEALPPFRPGQYISVQTDVPKLGFMQSRQYSLSDAYSPKSYRISVKREQGIDLPGQNDSHHPGQISNALHDSKHEGDVIQLSSPYGEFFLDLEAIGDAPVVLISAGVGLTPLVSMLNTLTQQPTERPITWIHATRTKDAQAFDAHVRSIVAANPNVHARVFLKNPKETDGHFDHVGRMDLSKVDRKDLYVSDQTARYYICGPEPFMIDTRTVLQSLGVDKERIKVELFGTGAMVDN
ncbi:hypothetical protein LTR08_003012 [Meristemomyces frigidus]|nr:hypothetical protein LTR08_003012 [Meristemomyces frigidus]